MKFANKIIWSCLITLAILFSIGSTFMIFTNHKQLLQSTIHSQLSNHDIEIYSLESRLFQDMLSHMTDFGRDEKLIRNKCIYYIQQFEAASNYRKTYALYSHNQRLLYSNMPYQLQTQVSSINNQTYSIRHIDNQYLVIMKSPISVGQMTYHLISSYDVTSLFQQRNNQLKTYVFVSGILYIIAFYILKIISQRLTKSIHKLNEVSKRISQGQYDERTCINTQDEIGELSQSFDEMAEMNEKTIHQLQESLVQKEDFMASFSHEIKTPMTAILGFADLLRTGDYDENFRQKAAQYIYTEGKRLENLSYTLLDLLSLSHQKIELEPVRLSDVFKQLKHYYQGQNMKNKIIFPEGQIYVLSQEELLFVVLRNLIDNARKASEDYQNIEILLMKKDNEVQISVKDYGVGMDEEAIQKATEAFYMADKSRSRTQGGAGLGLAIVKKICDLHHTELSFSSKVNEGTIVSFSLEVSHDE